MISDITSSRWNRSSHIRQERMHSQQHTSVKSVCISHAANAQPTSSVSVTHLKECEHGITGEARVWRRDHNKERPLSPFGVGNTNHSSFLYLAAAAVRNGFPILGNRYSIATYVKDAKSTVGDLRKRFPTRKERFAGCDSMVAGVLLTQGLHADETWPHSRCQWKRSTRLLT